MKLKNESKPRESRAEQGNETQEKARKIVLMNLGFWGFGFQYGVSAIFSLPFYIKVIREEDRMQRKNEIGAYNEALPKTSRITCA
jgi:hypothetical protein